MSQERQQISPSVLHHNCRIQKPHAETVGTICNHYLMGSTGEKNIKKSQGHAAPSGIAITSATAHVFPAIARGGLVRYKSVTPLRDVGCLRSWRTVCGGWRALASRLGQMPHRRGCRSPRCWAEGLHTPTGVAQSSTAMAMLVATCRRHRRQWLGVRRPTAKRLESIRQLDMDMRVRAKRVLPQESRLPAVWC
jgi:hypothetical protein